jgi:hypothetical protein
MEVIEVEEIAAVVVEAARMEEEGIVHSRDPLVLCPLKEKNTVVLVPSSVPIYTKSLTPPRGKTRDHVKEEATFGEGSAPS